MQETGLSYVLHNGKKSWLETATTKQFAGTNRVGALSFWPSNHGGCGATVAADAALKRRPAHQPWIQQSGTKSDRSISRGLLFDVSSLLGHALFIRAAFGRRRNVESPQPSAGRVPEKELRGQVDMDSELRTPPRGVLRGLRDVNGQAVGLSAQITEFDRLAGARLETAPNAVGTRGDPRSP